MDIVTSEAWAFRLKTEGSGYALYIKNFRLRIFRIKRYLYSFNYKRVIVTSEVWACRLKTEEGEDISTYISFRFKTFRIKRFWLFIQVQMEIVTSEVWGCRLKTDEEEDISQWIFSLTYLELSAIFIHSTPNGHWVHVFMVGRDRERERNAKWAANEDETWLYVHVWPWQHHLRSCWCNEFCAFQFLPSTGKDKYRSEQVSDLCVWQSASPKATIKADISRPENYRRNEAKALDIPLEEFEHNNCSAWSSAQKHRHCDRS